MLAAQPETRSTRRQNADVRTAGEELGDDRRSARQLLEVVEDEQQMLCGETIDERVEERSAGLGDEPEGGSDARDDKV
jgi:hypothetical protein